jgi:hypothetical protein
MLRELIDMVLVDPADRALFEFLGNRRENPDDEASPVTIPDFFLSSPVGRRAVIE